MGWRGVGARGIIKVMRIRRRLEAQPGKDALGHSAQRDVGVGAARGRGEGMSWCNRSSGKVGGVRMGVALVAIRGSRKGRTAVGVGWGSR